MTKRLLLATVVMFLAAGTAVSQDASKPAPCSAPENRQFDFWIGEWDVTQNGKPAGTNHVHAILGGCVIMEEWKSAKGPYAGKSFNRYDVAAGQWEQFWVDTSGGVLRLTGSYADGKMVLEGVTPTPDGEVLERITWHNNADGTVRQLWEKSKDGGDTWTTAFDGLYVKKN